MRDSLEETHSAAFELRRHFFLRLFDSELIADSSQAKVVAGGALGILLSLSLIFGQSYFQKYRALQVIDSPEPFRRAALADVLFLITLVMTVSALFTVIQWTALFPGLRDYLALAALPVRMRDIFLAKLSALLAVGAVVIAGTALPPSVLVPAMMEGRHAAGTAWHVVGIFVAGSLGGFFVFLTLIALQGVLLNVLPVRQFARVSLAAQGFLLAGLLGAMPVVFSIPDLHDRMDRLPGWARYAPPVWFYGIEQMIFGNRDAANLRLAERAMAALAASAAGAMLAYWWSYRGHRVRVLESAAQGGDRRALWPEAWSEKMLPGVRALGVFGFIAKSLARSRQHRLILTAFGGIAIAYIVEGFAGIVIGGVRGMPASSESVRESAIAIPLAISLFLLTGFRYLFRLPVEARANWVFRIAEAGHAPELLSGAERFLIYCAALPIAIFSLPIEVGMLGVRTGGIATLDCLLLSLLLVELLLFTFEKIPFTSTYLPGRRPVIETAIRYVGPVVVYIWGFAGVISGTARSGAATAIFLVILSVGWWRLRRARLGARHIARLEFEEAPAEAVQLLGIERE